MPGNRSYTADKLKHWAGEKMSPALINALNHPIRRYILRTLGSDPSTPMSPREMGQPLRAVGLSAVSYHVRTLCEQLVIKCVRTEQVRGSTQHFYLSLVAGNELLEKAL